MQLKLYKKIWQGDEGCSDSFSDFAQQAASHSWLDSAKCCSTRILPRNLISKFKAHIFPNYLTLHICTELQKKIVQTPQIVYFSEICKKSKSTVFITE